MNIIYKDFSDIGEYFEATRAKDFNVVTDYLKSIGNRASSSIGRAGDSIKEGIAAGTAANIAANQAMVDNAIKAGQSIKSGASDVASAIGSNISDAKNSVANDLIRETFYNNYVAEHPGAKITDPDFLKAYGEKFGDTIVTGIGIPKVSMPKLTGNNPVISPDMMPKTPEIGTPPSGWTGNLKTPVPGKSLHQAQKEAYNAIKDSGMDVQRALDAPKVDLPLSPHGVEYNPDKFAETMRGLYNKAENYGTGVGVKYDPSKVKEHMDTLTEEVKNPGLINSIKDIPDKAKEVINSITDLNGDGTTSGLEYGAIGAALAGATLAGAKALHSHHKNKKMKAAVADYARRYPNSKLAKAAGFSEIGKSLVSRRGR